MNDRILRRVPSLALLALLDTGCGEHAPFTAPVTSTDLVSQAPPSSGSGAGPVGSPDHVDSPWLWRTAEGNLLVIDRSTAVLFDGTHWARHAAPAETEITLEGGSGSPQQLLVEGSRRGYTWRYDELTVLSTADLATLHHGPGRVVDGAIAVPSAGARKATGQDPFQLAAAIDRARSSLSPATTLDFATTNDITGGNSGSPVVARDGSVIGAIFDGNLQSLGGTFGYDASVNRSVAVSTAAVEAALQTVYPAPALLAELHRG